MNKCEFYIQCGNQERYECMNSGRTADNSRAVCYSQRLAWAELARVAPTIDDEIQALKDATAPTHKLMRWETTV